MPEADGQVILIAGMQDDDRRRLGARLISQGRRVVAVRSGREAIDRTRDVRPDLVLLGAALGDMEAGEVCRQLREDEASREIPVIFVVGAAGAIDRDRTLTAGAVDFLPAGADDAELLARTACALEIKRLRDALRIPPEQDALTGLLNRVHFEKHYRRECNRSRRYDSLFSLVIVDVDRFREINSRHGLDFADAVLREAADVLRNKTRESDYVARWGGNEFILLLPEANLPKSIGFAKKLQAALVDHRYGPSETDIRLTVSMGVASRQNIGGRDPGDLLALTHECLHEAKHDGGDRIVYHTCGEFATVKR